MKQKITLKIVLTAMFVAAAVVIEVLFKLIPNFLPFGGSVNLAMFAIILLGFFVGPVYGIGGGIAFGVLNFFLDAGTANIHWGSFFLDYTVAFGLCGLSGFFKKQFDKGNLTVFILGIIASSVGRYLSSGFSGAIFFAEYAPEAMNPYFYSFIAYNAPYMAINCVLCLVLGILIFPQISKMNKMLIAKIA